MAKCCKKCGSTESLTKHSLWGGHKPPYVILCSICHNLEHDITKVRNSRQQRGNPKHIKGTRRKKK